MDLSHQILQTMEKMGEMESLEHTILQANAFFVQDLARFLPDKHFSCKL